MFFFIRINFFHYLQIPVYPNAPLARPQESNGEDDAKTSKRSLVIFSHGLGGSRTAYRYVVSHAIDLCDQEYPK